jgi:hypothetical protein
MQTERAIEGEVLDLAVREDEPPTPPLTLFGTSDPRVALERMSELAKALVDVVEDRKLYATIRGHRHITAEGWTTLGGMLGVVPVPVWTKPNESGDGIVARVEARTLDGRVVGAAESECSRAEARWKTADPYAIRSMAQTRAIGRALRAPLGQIVVLAGYEPAGAEEISDESEPAAAEPAKSPVDPVRPTREQTEQIKTLVRTLERIEPETDWWARCKQWSGVPSRMLTKTGAAMLIDKLQAELAAHADGESA